MKKFGLSEARARRYYPILRKVGHRLPLKPGAYSTLDRIGWERREAAEELKHSEVVLKLVQDLSRGRAMSNKDDATSVKLKWRQTSYGYVGTTVETDDRSENTGVNVSHKFEVYFDEDGSVRLAYTGPLLLASGGGQYFSVGGSLACEWNPGVEELVQMRLERIRDIAETYLIREHLQKRWQTRPSPKRVRRLAESSARSRAGLALSGKRPAKRGVSRPRAASRAKRS